MNQVFIPSQDMIFSTVEKDRQRLLAHCHSTKESVLKINLSEVLHCDSAGLAFLIEAKRVAALFHKDYQAIGMSKAIRALAEFCGVETILSS